MKRGTKDRQKNKRLSRLKKWIIILIVINAAVISSYVGYHMGQSRKHTEQVRRTIMAAYGQNREIEDGAGDPSLAVPCRNGTFVGQEKEGVRAFKGIPYALPPTGSLRWKKPVPAPEDTGTYEAYYFGKSCIQTDADTERASFYPQGEDCLTLNVWSAPGQSGKPVMVFFHGGAYGWGGTADPLYDGHQFVKAHEDIVLVTVNYRVGLMGFMDFSRVKGGEAYAQSGNLGLLDQICALQWIRDNIDGFGGDPARVTIFGESAGASSVSLLPLIDEAKGLFQRVIAQSGAVAFTFSKEEAQTLTEMLLKETGASSMQDLCALSEEQLMKVNRKLNDYNNFPVRDGVILPEDPYAAYENGAGADIDMMIGTNADEARYWIGEVGGYPVFRIAGRLLYKSTISRIRPEDRPYADAFMELQTDEELWNMTEFINDLVFRVPSTTQACAHAASGGRTYMYYWTKESAIPYYGACHAVELAYIFGNLDDTIFTGERADDALARTVQDMWVNFAKTGDPSVPGHAWRPYEPIERNTMFLGDTIEEVSDPMREQRVLIEPLLPYHFNGYYKSFDYAMLHLRRDILTALGYLVAAEVVIYFLYRCYKAFRKRYSISRR